MNYPKLSGFYKALGDCSLLPLPSGWLGAVVGKGKCEQCAVA